VVVGVDRITGCDGRVAATPWRRWAGLKPKAWADYTAGVSDVPHSAVQRLKTELPLLGGLLLGALGMVLRADALVLDGRVSGYHWPAWMFGAWNHAHGRMELLDPFRQPLHSALVGTLGPWLGLLDASLLLAGLSMLTVVVASGLSVRLVAGPWAGALAAAAVPLSPVATSGARWGTAYPLLTGALAAAVAASVWASRKPSVARVGMAGGAAMYATMADERGLLLLAVVLPLLAWRAIGSVPARGLAVVVVAGALLGTRSAPWLGQSHTLTAAEKRAVQTLVVARWATESKDVAMVDACRTVSPQTLLTPAFLTTSCAPQVLRHNLQQALPGATAFPLWVLLLAVVSLAAPRRWRDDPAAPLLGMGVVLAGLGTAVWTPLPARYQLFYTGFLGLLVPLSLGWRLRRHPRVCAMTCGGLWLLVAVTDPHEHDRYPVKGIDARWLQPADLATVVRGLVPPSVPVRDCARASVELALLPDHTAPRGPELSIPDARPCLEWIRGTSPRALVVRPRRTLPGTAGPVDIAATVASTPEWVLGARAYGVEIWLRR